LTPGFFIGLLEVWARTSAAEARVRDLDVKHFVDRVHDPVRVAQSADFRAAACGLRNLFNAFVSK